MAATIRSDHSRSLPYRASAPTDYSTKPCASPRRRAGNGSTRWNIASSKLRRCAPRAIRFSRQSGRRNFPNQCPPHRKRARRHLPCRQVPQGRTVSWDRSFSTAPTIGRHSFPCRQRKSEAEAALAMRQHTRSQRTAQRNLGRFRQPRRYGHPCECHG